MGPVKLDRFGPPTLGALSGLLYALSIPKAGLFYLAWVALVPLIGALAFSKNRTQLLTTGLLAGLISATARTYWISETLQLYGNLPLAVAIPTNVLLIAYMALYSVAFVWCCSRIAFHHPHFSWYAAGVWTLLEWMQNWMISGFPWQLIGYSQYPNLPFLQWASISGIYGLSFVIALFNSALAQALYHRSIRRYLLIPCTLLLLIIAWGSSRLNQLDTTQVSSVRIGVVQGNISQDRKWKVNRLEWTTDHYTELTRSVAQQDPVLVIFPETALPYYFNDPFYTHYRQRIMQLTQETGVPLLVGSLEGEIGNKSAPVYNRAFMLNADGQIAGTADKVHLVPFGEYLPMPYIFQYLEGLTAESGQFAHGQSHRTIALPSQDISIGPFICYESIFPEITRELTLLGADILVNTTNDAWFGQTAAPYQHFAMSIIRAVETGRAVVRAANTGISGVIQPSGRIQYMTGLEETTTFVEEVPIHRENTLYTRFGNSILALCVLVLVLGEWKRRSDA
tara:strand:+ start:180 stop:1706 length:1527 start_codon:yes stop_codon:yes gene_type:complete